MNGSQIESVLDLIDSNIHSSMKSVSGEILEYLRSHADELAEQIAEKGYGVIPTSAGEVRVSKEDLKPAAYAA